jgi:hypothetical protein
MTTTVTAVTTVTATASTATATATIRNNECGDGGGVSSCNSIERWKVWK